MKNSRLKRLLKMTYTYKVIIILIIFILVCNLIYLTTSSRSHRNEPMNIPIRSKQMNSKSIDLLINYESLCPDSESFIVNQLAKAVSIFRDNLNLQLIPFGKASYKFNPKSRLYEFTCQHGPKECFGNIIQVNFSY
jgi:hypothetical protein